MMFIGGGSASTAGGIKITTFLLLAYVILAELRGDREVTDRFPVDRTRATSARRSRSRCSRSMLVTRSTTFMVMSMTDFDFDEVLFECTSAFATVGLSTGHHAGAARRRASSSSSS